MFVLGIKEISHRRKTVQNYGANSFYKEIIINIFIMLSLNEIKISKVLEVSGEPFLVTKTDHHKMGRGGAVLKVKLKNLINGNMLDKTFQGNDKADEAEVQKKKQIFIQR